MPAYTDCKFEKHVLTISIPVTVGAKTGVSVMLDKVERIATNPGYDEGRFPLEREMFQHALQMLLKQAVYDSVYAFMVQKHGMSTSRVTGPGCTTNVAYEETAKWMSDDFYAVHPDLDGWTVTCQKVQPAV